MSNLNLKYKKKYGMKWPVEVHDIQIDLMLAKKWREPEFRGRSPLKPGEHLLRAIRALFKPDEWIISPWTEEHAHAWCDEKTLGILGCASSSKAQPLDAVVYTPTGAASMASIAVGDMVIGASGMPTRVVQTHDVGEQPVYEMLFSDGARTRCAGTHLWSVQERRKDRTHRVVTAEWLSKRPSRRYAIPLCKPVQFSAQPVLIDPYLLGVLLGDGSLGSSTGRGMIRLASADAEIVDAVRAALPSEYALRQIGRFDYGLVRLGPKGVRNAFIGALRTYGLWGKLSHAKHIPTEYLVNTEQVRRDILAGLLDTDGCATVGGSITFSSTSRALAEGVAFLARSLGGRATTHSYPSSYRQKSGELKRCRDCHIVRISMVDAPQLFRLKRKVARTKVSANGTGSRYLVSAVRTDAVVPMKCLTVADPTGLYLTDDFIVTHNSNDIGGFCVLDWICDPTSTITIMASTSKLALADRSYESVLRYFQILKANPNFSIPGKIHKTSMAIINDSDDEYGKLATTKAAIRGVAVQEGTADEARTNLQGRHMPYVRLVLDEFAGMRQAAADARTNLRIGASKDFKWVYLANPDSLFDLSARYSEPEPGGWATVSSDTPRWRSAYGLVLHHNGYQSPAVTEPDGATKYPYLINQEQIDATIKDAKGNEDAKEVWTMVKGFPPRAGVESTILSETDVTAFNMTVQPVWDDRSPEIIRVAGLDPAFTSGGDGVVFQPLEIGLVREGSFVCAFMDPEYFPIRESAARPATYQVVDRLGERCAELGIPIDSVAIDDSGTQSVCDVVAVELGIQPIRCNFGAGASEFPLSSTNLKPANERYRNLVTELWCLLAEYGRFGQLRRLPQMAARQFCLRKFKAGAGLKILESKKDFKKRLPGQRSPDEGDAAALAVWAARAKAGIRPGFTSLQDRGIKSRMGNSEPQFQHFNSAGTSYKKGIDLSRFAAYSKS